ncbi:MAG: sigma-54 dependent transcriptional regulator [bacterium]
MSAEATAAGDRILVVDDSPTTLELLRRNLTEEGYTVFTVSGVKEALELLEHQLIDLVITDMKMPRISGIDLVRHIHENLRETGVMMVTGYATVEGAVEAMREGATEYIAKPFTEDELISAVRRSLERVHMRCSSEETALAGYPSPPGLIGQSRSMSEVYKMIGKAALSNATVLITGESGTGKELVARAIHYGSPRADAPFVPVTLSGVPETLVESALFGHVKGAFTGANETRTGFLHAAQGGTLFLDEVSEIPLPIQVKLLRVLQEREYLMVGSMQQKTADVRVLAATNRDLLKMVRAGQFREDLYFRLNVIPIALPPLRDRPDDIPLLVHHFAKRFAEADRRPMPVFSDAVMAAFSRHDWPGNVRELENVIQRVVVMAEGNQIEPPDLPELMRFRATDPESESITLAQAEVRHILAVLANVGGNKSKAARLLGIDRKTLREKLKATKSGEEGR